MSTAARYRSARAPGSGEPWRMPKRNVNMALAYHSRP